MSTAIPNVNDLVAGDVEAVYEYFATTGDDVYTPEAFNVYQFDDKISVASASGGEAYDVYVDLNGDDELLFTGTVDSSHVIPKAMALECGGGFLNQVIDLSAGPMHFARYLEVGATDKNGAYLVTMTGAGFAADLAQMDTYKSIAMVDIESGIAILKNNIAIRAGYVEIAGGAMRVEETLDYGGDLSIVDGSMKIGTGDVAVFNGIFNDLGIVYGHGTLDIVGGYMSVASGAKVAVKTWVSKGTATHAAGDYIEDKLTFTGDFIVGGNTQFTFYKGADLTVNEIRDINGAGGTFSMYAWDPIYEGDEIIDVLGGVGKGESFNIGVSDVLELGDPTKFKGVIDQLAMGSHPNATLQKDASGAVALDGIWNYVSTKSNGGDTVVTMQDVADGLLAHIDFLGTWTANEFTFFDQIKGVTPTTVIDRTVTS